MLFRPKYCANCGEKIERADWGIFTSRRFCPVCESEYKGQDLIPRAIVVFGLLIGIFGFGSYLKSGTAPANSLAARQPSKLVEQKPPDNPPPLKIDAAAAQSPTVQTAMTMPQTLAAQPASNGASKLKPDTNEVVYYCGAETKKGTPCTRRVKGNTRCFQHKGMPAMLSVGKLRMG